MIELDLYYPSVCLSVRLSETTTCINSISFLFKAKHKNNCFMIHEILKYEKKKFLMEKMGNSMAKPQQCLENTVLCRGWGRGDLNLLR